MGSGIEIAFVSLWVLKKLPKIVFSDKSISAIVDVKGTFDQVTRLNTDSGKMFRLYNASFKRLPDPDGLVIELGILVQAKMMKELLHPHS